MLYVSQMSEYQPNLSSDKPDSSKLFKLLPASLKGLLTVVFLAWVLELIDRFLPGNGLDSLGIEPRSITGLIGIPLMPFLHGDFGHLASNTVPFLILGWIVLKAERENFLAASVVIILLSGIGTWLIGRSSIHIGASALIYGYLGYILARAWMERRPLWIATGLIVGIFFGSMLFGMIPGIAGHQISWEGHLCGMIAGAWFGWRKSKKLRITRASELPELKDIDDLLSS